ncbi:MAG: alpha-amylase family glycosyl hydrolase [Planctomycetaceae bacterium]
MIDLNEVGAHVVSPGKVRFGIYLPEITAAKGYSIHVRMIHEQDQFTPEIPPKDFPLTFDPAHPLGLWSATVDIPPNADGPSHFGTPGRYFYFYRLLRQQPIVTPVFTDPFAREAGPARLAAFTIDNPAQPAPPFSFDDEAFTVPPLDDLVVYELQVQEFYSTFDGVIPQLDYLKGLGVNVLELMPVTDFPQVFDWGYGPLHFFAPEDRWGGPAGLKRLVKACHARGIAVILDVVYQHCSADFAYVQVYHDSGEHGPMGDFPNGPFGPQFTYQNSPFTQDYVRAANRHWLEEYHVDGFRYDNVKGFFSGPIGPDYANVVFQTYQDSASIPRFQDPKGFRRIIQVAEFIDANPQTILIDTFSNATWQDNLLNKAADMAQHNFVDDDFAHLLDPSFLHYPNFRDFGGVAGPVAPFQYIESHDHSDFICNFGLIGGGQDIQLGDRNRFYKTQPYAIALYTCQGIPMLWQGQEFGENYVLPGSGTTRIQIRRDVHWEYFYDDIGQVLIRVYRRLGRLRRACRALRGRESFYFNQNSNLGGQAIAYSRHAPATATEPEQFAMVFLNFSDSEQTLSVPFPIAGTYREMLDDDIQIQGGGHREIVISSGGQFQNVQIPSNYGQIYVTPVLPPLQLAIR